MKDNAYLRERLYIPIEKMHEFYKTPFMYYVENLEVQQNIEELNLEGEDPNYIKTYKETPDGKWVGFHRGDIDKVYRIFEDDFTIVDQRAFPKFNFDLKLNDDFQWRHDQKDALDAFLSDTNTGGILQAYPAFGKTVWVTAYMVTLGVKTLFVADVGDILSSQFEETVRKWTNINSIEKECGEKLIGKMSKNNYSVFPITYTTFQYIFKNPEYAKEIKDEFGLIIIDECHSVAARTFARAATCFNAKIRVGLSATPKRKDKLHVVFPDLIGNIRYRAKTRESKTKMIFINTGLDIGGGNSKMAYSRACSNISDLDSRNHIICKEILKKINEGHKCMILVARKKHCFILSEMMKREYKIKSSYLTGENKHEKADIVKRMNLEYEEFDKIDVCVCTSKLLGKGFNLPSLSCLIIAHPVAYAGTIEQFIGRIERQMEGKKDPRVLYIVDKQPGLVQGCYRIVKRFCADKHIPIEYDKTYADEIITSENVADVLGAF